MLKGILFDMDGVLFDTERPVTVAERRVAEEMGFAMSEEQFLSLPGLSTVATLQTLLGWFGPAFNGDAYLEQVNREVRAYFDEHGIQTHEGISQLLPALKRQSWRLAVASATVGEKVRHRLEQGGVAAWFDAVVTADDVAHTKPAPDAFLAAAGALGLSPAECVAVEDSYNGVRSAHAAGCVTVMIPDLVPPTDEMRGLCDAILGSALELPAFLEERRQAE